MQFANYYTLLYSGDENIMINYFYVFSALMRNFVLNLLNFMKVPLKLTFLSVYTFIILQYS